MSNEDIMDLVKDCSMRFMSMEFWELEDRGEEGGQKTMQQVLLIEVWLK